MYMLTQHPDVEKRLREEIFDKVGPSSNPTYEQMRDMKFMRAFLNGLLRYLNRKGQSDLHICRGPEAFPPRVCKFSFMSLYKLTIPPI